MLKVRFVSAHTIHIKTEYSYLTGFFPAQIHARNQ